MKDKTTILLYLVVAAFVVALLGRTMMSSKMMEGFGLQTVAMPVDGGGPGLYNGMDELGGGSWGEPGAAPLKPYEAADDNVLMQYQYSEFKVECCPSAISNDVGCLCPTKKEKREWLTRGGNRVPM